MKHHRQMTAPICIGFVGMDGAGKSAIAAGLQTLMEETTGRTVKRLSWRQHVSEEASHPGTDIIETLHAASKDCWFRGAEAVVNNADPCNEDLQTRFASALGVPGQRSPIAANDADFLLTAFLLELAADLYFHKTAVDAALRRGQDVILESFGVKPVIKLLQLAELAQADGLQAGSLIDKAMPLVRHIYGESCRCDLCFHVVVDPLTARDRRLSRRRFGFVEDLSLLGDSSPEGFVTFQSRVNDLYGELARTLGWEVVENQTHRLDDTVERVFHRVSDATAAQGDRCTSCTRPPGQRCNRSFVQSRAQRLHQ
ncbi:hypothetical protein [Thalassococcus sp. S3]|uniref:hypothetical protein n=1 Tax=Thalassococcus sp. S3 TaxID=2017482 RepID=UPI0010242691|nr:hypothetical protein [Thalassococcus sp. S3]QBF29643.1 hypothetical protein CFI11_00235 [Thalassococcus sp. S3]